ncbi:unnamed protein product [Dovyalis caffra]|uniref:DUF4219 domain-containing protein n=1 Tax=Dovyalis caffra TaxID=77055 RepID=A0AAV1QX89_9ROSI|nr:unnamed protein product [Dovyalis caffra]
MSKSNKLKSEIGMLAAAKSTKSADSSFSNMATHIFPSAIVVEVLRDDNYENWRCCMKSYMLAQGLWDIVEPTIRTPIEKDAEADTEKPENQEVANADSKAADNQEGDDPNALDQVDSEAPDGEETAKADLQRVPDNQEAAEVGSKAPDNQEGAQTLCKKVPVDQEVAKADSKALDDEERPQTDSEGWCKRNAAALHAIQISCAPDILSKIRNIDSARKAWDTLANMQKLQLSTVEPELSTVNAGLVQNEYSRWLELFRYAHEGNWDETKRFLDQHPDAINAKISHFGVTALHVATIAGNAEVVEKLVELMSPEDLEIEENGGCTALSYAAREGITKMAKCMIRKNKNLANLPNGAGLIPVVVSCIGNHKDMTRYLYSVAPFELLSILLQAH